jgi:hypothetical protein
MTLSTGPTLNFYGDHMTLQGNEEALHVSKFKIIDAGIGPQFPNLYYTIPPNTGMKVLAQGPTGSMTVVLEGREVQ